MKKVVFFFFVLAFSLCPIRSVYAAGETSALSVESQPIFMNPDTDSIDSPIDNPENFSEEYMSGLYYQTLKNVTLSGDYRTDILAVAVSQLGYHEGNQEDQLNGCYNGNENYSEYGRYLGSNGTEWCSEFASWCARMANVPTSILNSSYGASVEIFGAPYYHWSQTIYAGGEYTPHPGDIVLFAWTGKAHTDKYLSHTAIVYNVAVNDENEVIITVIDGNTKNCVRMHDYKANTADGNTGNGHVVYFIAPDYERINN